MNDFDGEEAAQPDRSRGNETRSNDDSGKPDDAVAPMGHSVAECSTAQESDQTTGATATDNPDRPATETRRKEMQICNSEPRRTASATSWISEMTSKSQDEASAEQYRPGGHHRSVPQIQLPKFSGRATEWPQWIGLFKTLIHDQKCLSDAEKLAHLQSSVTGLAKQAVEGMLYDGALYPVALETLMERFGKEQDIVNANLSAVFCTPPMKELDPTSLEKFHAVVHCAVKVLENMGFEGDLNSTENLRRIVFKLPNELKREWGRRIVEMEPTRPNLRDFDSWLSRQVRIVMTLPAKPAEYGRTTRFKGDRSKSLFRPPSAPATLATAPKASTKGAAPPTRYGEPQCNCGEQHELSVCPSFLQRSKGDRAKFVGESGRCFLCLKSGHRSRHCPSEERCGEDGCQGRHHRLLHGCDRVFPRNDSSFTRRTVAATTPQQDEMTLLQIVPVRVHGDGTYADTFAILDSGAQTSLCTERLAKKLQLKGEIRPLSLSNVEGSGPQRSAMKTSLKLTPLAKGSESGSVTANEVWTVPRLNVPVPQLSSSARSKWRHLNGLDIAAVGPDEVEVLLGANVIEAILQREVRVGRPGQPVAIKTHFGWALTGTIAGIVPTAQQHVMHVHRCTSQEDELNELLQDWWRTDSFGASHTMNKESSHDDRRAIRMLEETTRLQDGRFECGLLWKNDEVTLPNNRIGALRRLERTEKSLQNNPGKAKAYKEAIDKYVSNGHAGKLRQDDVADDEAKRWYLPHHAVFNQHKPGKIRIVFDASAEFHGTSLNKQLLTGPDLLQELPAILMRFREKAVAIAGDIDQMFHQVRLRKDDRPALSFLWRDMECGRPPDTYEMKCGHFRRQVLASNRFIRAAESHRRPRRSQSQQGSSGRHSEPILHG